MNIEEAKRKLSDTENAFNFGAKYGETDARMRSLFNSMRDAQNDLERLQKAAAIKAQSEVEEARQKQIEDRKSDYLDKSSVADQLLKKIESESKKIYSLQNSVLKNIDKLNELVILLSEKDQRSRAQAFIDRVKTSALCRPDNSEVLQIMKMIPPKNKRFPILTTDSAAFYLGQENGGRYET